MEKIQFIDRSNGELITEDPPGKGWLAFLYGSNFLGKLTLHGLFKRKILSALGGWYMNHKTSKKRIDAFITDNGIDMQDYMIPEDGFKHFNDFFYRNVKNKARPIESDFVSPADGKILAFNTISEVDQFFIKGQPFDLKSFLGDASLTKKYDQGAMLIIRLAPVDYHRFHFPCSGYAGPSALINGHYFSVSPIALQKSLKIFCQNKRTISILKNEKYGDVLISEVGATMVGSIIQTYDAEQEVKVGDEKGYFAFGGSTVVLLLEQGRIQFAEDLLEHTSNGMETSIKMGEKITL